MTVDAAVLTLPTSLVAEVTGAAARTVQRWRAGTRPRRTRYVERLEGLALVLDDLGPRMTAGGRQAWLTAPSAFLDGERPVDALARGEAERAAAAARAYAGGEAV